MDVNSTIEKLEEFKESIIWLDICNELRSWKDGFVGEMLGLVDDVASTNPTTASLLTHLGDVNGRIKAIDFVLCVVDTLIDSKRVAIENSDSEEGDE